MTREMQAANDVRALISVPGLLRPKWLPDALVVPSWELARTIAWRTERADAGLLRQHGIGQLVDWTGLRESVVAELRERGEHLGAAFRSNESELTHGLGVELEDYLRRELAGELLELFDDIYADLLHHALTGLVVAHATVGETLFGRMLEIYRAGYWPCGWEGDYVRGSLLPRGRPIAYRQPATELERSGRLP